VTNYKSDCAFLLSVSLQTDTKPFYLPRSQMSRRTMIVPILTFLILISSTAKGSLQITNHEYPLMHFTKLLSEKAFTPGLPLVVVLPLAIEESNNKEVGYLIEKLHKSGRWPILVHNASYNMKGYMYTEIHPHGSYIILISGPCKLWELHIFHFWVQLNYLSIGDNTWHIWNPNAKFIVSVMSNCTHMENTNFSRSLLTELWFREVMNAAVLFLKSKEQDNIDMQGKPVDSAQGTYLELHTWYPYENSDRCNPTEGTVPVKVFTVRHSKDIRRSDIFRGHNVKNFQGCPFKVYVTEIFPLVYPPKLVRYNDSHNQRGYEEGMEIEMLKVIGNSLNMSLDIAEFREVLSFLSTGNRKKLEVRKGEPFILVGWFPGVNSALDKLCDYTRSYLTERLVWYTPCPVKYERLSHIFNIFSVDICICLAMSVFLAIITVRCISNYGHKSHLHESSSYSNISSVTSNIIAVSLSVCVNAKPRSAPLRLFFFCWVWYSVAISTVFQAYLTTFLIEPGYEKPIKTFEQMLNSNINFGLTPTYRLLFHDTSHPVESAVFKDSVECPDDRTCFIWAAKYHNISTILNDLHMGIYCGKNNWINENNRQLLCELKDGVVRTVDFAISVRKRSHFFEFINDVTSRIVEGGIFMHIKKRVFEKEEIRTEFTNPSSDDKYFVLGVSHLQTVFYLLMLGYVLAVVCFVTEIMWHRYRSKEQERTCTSLCHS